MMDGRRWMWVAALLGTVASAAPFEVPSASAQESTDATTLVLVNGDAITSTELDRLLISTHQKMETDSRDQFDYRRLLDKLINDQLLFQEAEVMGIGEAIPFQESMQEDLWERAVTRFVAREFERPTEIPEPDLKRRFEEYYWKIQLRQVSLRTEEEALGAISEIRAGASMEEMALERSLDTKRLKGGLHNLLHWADVTVVLRSASQDLDVGQISDPFPINDAYGFVRVEQRLPLDDAEYSKFRGSIKAWILKEVTAVAWDEFLADIERNSPLTLETEALGSIEADSADVLQGTFLKESDRPALVIQGLPVVTEGELRREISHQGMNDGLASFQTLLERGTNMKRQSLLLRAGATAGSYLEDPEVRARHEEYRRASLIEMYLGEVIAPQIKFNRGKFENYYESNLDQFRRPDQVLLGTLTIEDEGKAREAYERLQGGADFEYLRDQYSTHGQAVTEESKWVTLAIFSPEIAEELSELEIGQASRPLEIPNGWMIFNLKSARRGEIKPIDEVDMKIREVMFQQEFTELMDGHLALLRERSDVQEFPERIDDYFQGGDTDGQSPSSGER